LATYKYQQNFFDGAASGYVRYNIAPDFGTPVSVGDVIEITGQYYDKNSISYGIECYGRYTDPATGKVGNVSIGKVIQTISKARVASFAITYVIDEEFFNKYGTTERNFTAVLNFTIFERSDLLGGTSPMADSAHALNCLKYRLPPEITDASFADSTGAVAHFGGAVQGKSMLSVNSTFITDPLDSTVEITDARVYFNDAEQPNTTFAISEDNVLTVTIGALNSYGTLNAMLRVKDNKGLSGTFDLGAITVYPYSAPTIVPPNDDGDIVQRYNLITDDTGNEVAEAADDGQYVWVSLNAFVMPINGKNQWTLSVKWLMEGGSEPEAVTLQIASANDGASLSLDQSKETIPETYMFDSTHRYNFVFTLSDFFGDTILEFMLDKAGGFFNVEKYGVGVGMRTTGTEASPKFESAYPAYFYAGINGVTNYSTSEVATGGRWINGKPIYRRMLVQPITKASTYTDYDIGADVDMIINFSGVLVLSNGTERPLGWWWNGGNDRWTVYRYGKSSAVSFWATAVPSTGYVLIEYTKTTDAAE